MEDDDPCHQRKCTSNEHCCDGHVCVDTQNSGGGDGGGGVDESGDSDDDIGDGGDGGDGGDDGDVEEEDMSLFLSVTGSCLPVFGKKEGEVSVFCI